MLPVSSGYGVLASVLVIVDWEVEMSGTRAGAGAAAIARMDAFLAENSPVATPMLKAIETGALSRDELRAFATQYFHLVDALPRFVSTTHSVTIAHPKLRRMLLEVLMPMELQPPSVAELWLQTCASLGLFSDSVRSSDQNASTSVCLADFEYLCQSGCAQGLAALYTWMRRLPKACAMLRDGLAEHYDLAGGPGREFFDVVIFQFEAHARAIRAGLEGLIDEFPDSAEVAVDAVRGATRAAEGMYAGALEPASSVR